jgi:hypothetical protein
MKMSICYQNVSDVKVSYHQSRGGLLKKWNKFLVAIVVDVTFVAGFLCTPASFDRSTMLRWQVAEAFNQDGDEFVGPFASWANVKTQYGAVGNGVADDTTALQNALNDLGQSGKASVMYLPAGVYRITSTLTMAARIDISVIGEDPAITSIVWDGSAGGTMLYLNGVAYSRFDRLTWDGRKKADIAIDQSWSGTGNYFDTGNEYVDDTFIDVGYGIQGGFLGYGFAETSVLRCHFTRNSQAGISLGNFNALDLFVWNSTFEDNTVGVSNAFKGGAGNFNIYNSTFKNSTFADIYIGNTGGFSFRNNFSIGSARFIYAGSTGNPATMTIQGNTILDTTATPTPIWIGNEGPVFLVDNVLRSLPTVTSGPVVYVANWNPTDLFSIGNTFTVSNPTYVYGRGHSIDDKIVSRSSINATAPTLPGTLPNYHRQVFEVPPGASAATIQQIINTAAGQNGLRPVVHLPPGRFSVDTTIVIPANTDLQIVGDGGASMVAWTVIGAGPVFRLAGPSKATLRDFEVDGGGIADGIVVENADQAGSRIFMEQPSLSNYKHNLFVDGLDYTNVQLQDFYHAGSRVDTASIKILGGPSTAAGTWLSSKTNIFSGASSNNGLSYEVGQGAHLTVRDIWYETGTSSPQFTKLTGNSTFSFSGSRIALPVSSTSPAIDVNNFTGKATFLETLMDGNLVISGNGSEAKVLGIGLVGPSQHYFANSASPAAQALLLNSMTTASTIPDSGASQIPEQGVYDPSFIRDMLSQIRTEQPTSLSALPAGVTDLRLYRVVVEEALTGIHVMGSATAGSTASTAAPATTTTPPSQTWNLTISSSNPANSVSVIVSPNDNNGQGNGSSQLTRTYNNNTAVTLTAPSLVAGNNFSGWIGCGSSSGTTCNLTMNASKTVTATYVTPPVIRTLTIVSSNPTSGASITISPNDNNSQGNGLTQATRTYNNNTAVILTAAATATGNNFSNWSGCDTTSGTTCNVNMSANKTVIAVYVTPTRTLTVASSNPASGVPVTFSQNDINGNGKGSSKLTRVFTNDTVVTVTAPSAVGGNKFGGWNGCDSSVGVSCEANMKASKTVTALYVTPPATRSLMIVSSNPPSGISINESSTDSKITRNLVTQIKVSYSYSAVVTLTAPSKAQGHNFINWSGCDSSTGTVCSVTMTANKTVEAAYAKGR